MKIKKILIIFEQSGSPQSYVRGEIYIKKFYQDGIKVKTAFLKRRRAPSEGTYAKIKNRVLDKLYSRLSFANELRITLLARRYDLVLLIKVSSFRLVELVKKYSSTKLIYDLSDIVNTKSHKSPAIKEIENILPLVDAVTYDYTITKKHALTFNKNSYYWPICSQVESFDKARGKKNKNEKLINIGWIGSPSTSFHLFKIWEPLERLFSKYDNLHLMLLGVDKNLMPRFENISYSCLDGYYNHDTMIQEALKMDLGLYPLFLTEAAKSHGYLKALIYMSAGTATVCSPVGDLNKLIIDGNNGFLAKNEDEWFDKLEKLIINQDLREKITTNGLKMARSKEFTIKNSYEALKNIYELKI